jgi:hypothetical protein
MSVSETELKDIVKTAMAEVLVEQRALVREILEEVLEDIAMSRAMDEGISTSHVTREEVFTALDAQ